MSWDFIFEQLDFADPIRDWSRDSKYRSTIHVSNLCVDIIERDAQTESSSREDLWSTIPSIMVEELLTMIWEVNHDRWCTQTFDHWIDTTMSHLVWPSTIYGSSIMARRRIDHVYIRDLFESPLGRWIVFQLKPCSFGQAPCQQVKDITFVPPAAELPVEIIGFLQSRLLLEMDSLTNKLTEAVQMDFLLQRVNGSWELVIEPPRFLPLNIHYRSPSPHRRLDLLEHVNITSTILPAWQPVKSKEYQEWLAVLRSRWERGYGMDQYIISAGWTNGGYLDYDGYYLAGLGYTLDQLRRGPTPELNRKTRTFCDLRQSVYHVSDEEAFLLGFNDKAVCQRYLQVRRLNDYLNILNSPIPKWSTLYMASSEADSFYHYMAGAGVTPELLAQTSKVERAKLYAAFEASETEFFDAFIAGLDY